MKSNAVEIKDVFFSYRTPRKEDYFKNVPFLFKRVVTEKKEVLHGITLNLAENQITALLGRNGSGKTTLINLITGARTPDKGSVTVLGKKPFEARSDVGVCLGGSLIYYRLTARENLEYYGRLYGMERRATESRIVELTEMLELDDVLDDMVESYSYGMKMKVSIARSLIHSPKLLLLDEPTQGVDLHQVISLRRFFKSLKCTVLLTTHDMGEAEELADNVCVIDQGKINAMGTKEEVLGIYQTADLRQAFLHATGA